MQVNRVQAHNNQPKFGAMYVTPEGRCALRKVFNPEQLEQVAKLSKELENTKHFDLSISAICDGLLYVFKHKTNPHLSSEAPLHPYAIKGNRLDSYGIDLSDCGDIFIYGNLRFPTAKEARKAYSKLSDHADRCFPFPYATNSFDKFKWAVDSTKILDRATEYTGSDAIVYGSMPSSIVKQPKPIQHTETVKPSKLSITQLLKNAWHALKGD